ncbi:hypothetical protein BK809_0000292 [Diplodia seriata]|uniref:Uncharacterized protein n=1 Tax=Diplodia seriata TaxID=420778 RepID=A0A1S8BCB0_9PEZI|nr:hypothetical protein BK809_0000292 [Diplodia seriata]
MKKAHADYGAALVAELRLAFGNHVGELESWRKLCKAVGVPQKRLPADVDRCRELLHGKHINLVDLASWARWRGDEVQGKTVAAFESASALHRYARITWKAFPREYLETVKLNDSRGRSEVVPYLLGTMLDRCRKNPAFGLYSGPPLREDERMESLKRAIEKWERERGPINAEGPISLKMFGQKKPRYDLLQDLSVEEILVI